MLHPTSLGRFKSAVIFQKIRDTGRPEMSEANSALAGLCQIARKKLPNNSQSDTQKNCLEWRRMMPVSAAVITFLEQYGTLNQ